MAKRSKRQQSVSSEQASSPSGQSPTRGPKSTAALDMILLGLAGVGIFLTTYLTYVAWFEVHPAFCIEGSGCDLVQASRWSTLLGMPMAFWGLLTYLVMARLIWRGRKNLGSWTILVFVAVCGFAISAYLTVVSVIEIEATCPYCLASFAIITPMRSRFFLTASAPSNTKTTTGPELI